MKKVINCCVVYKANQLTTEGTKLICFLLMLSSMYKKAYQNIGKKDIENDFLVTDGE